MRSVVVLSLLVACALAAPYTEWRLIEFNETSRVWMSVAEVEAMVAECGKDAGGFMDITDHQDFSPAEINPKLLAAFPNRLAFFTYFQTALAPLMSTSKDQLITYNNQLSAFFTRYYTTATGKQAAEYIFSEFSKAAVNPLVEVAYFPHSWVQPSVIARIKGSGPTANEIVIISAHEDSVNNGANGRSPGADDDASGTSTVLEIFRILIAAGFKPQRTLEFHTYAAEEVGLRGSQDIAESYQKAGKLVYAQMQMDMTLYVKPGTRQEIGIVTDFTSSELNAFVRILASGYCTIPHIDTRCGYACSDHGSWNKYGYAASFPFEGAFSNSNNQIHTANDVIGILNIDHGLQFVRLGLGFAVELSLA